MSLEEVLRKAVEHINSGSLSNEAQVKQAVILPILRALDWDDSDPAEFVPEYSVDNGWVDYALLRSVSSPLVFIEAKGLGLVSTDGEEQVFGYAVNKGVPFLILTDGDLWDFYLSMAEGVPAERRFYRAELKREERISEYVEFLETFLRKNRVVSGEARRAAEQRHESNQEREKARNAIPGAWRTLLEAPEEMLRDLLAEEVESQCGTKPDLSDVETFLKGFLSDTPLRMSYSDSPPRRSRSRKLPPPTRQMKSKDQSKIIGFTFGVKESETGTAIGTLAEILEEFCRRDSEFMVRFAARTVGRKRNLVAQDRHELYPDRPDLVEKSSRDIGNGWWLGTNISADKVRASINTACEVAGVKFGTQLTLKER